METHFINLLKQFKYDSLESEKNIFDALSFFSLYACYLDVEALNFPSSDQEHSWCKFPTIFSHYALSVCKTVETLEQNFQNRFSYYTILNRRPKNFFNIDNHGSDAKWSINFIEKFCRSHHQSNIKYIRSFVTCNAAPAENADFVAHYDASEDLKAYLLCSAGKPVLVCPSSQYDELINTFGDEWKDVVINVDQEQETLKKMGIDQDINELRYVIIKVDKKDEILSKIQTYKLDNFSLIAIKDLLPDYHSKTHPCDFLRFADLVRYKSFFEFEENGKKYNIPRDLFAVKDNNSNKWILCIGVYSSLIGKSNVVEIAYFSPLREAINLPWNIIESRLDMLFNGDIPSFAKRIPIIDFD